MEETFSVTINQVDGDKIRIDDMCSTSTLMELKERIMLLFGYAPDRMKFTKSGKQLLSNFLVGRDERNITFEDCKI